MKTLHVGLRVENLQRSLGFWTVLGYEVIGEVPHTELGSLTMLKLPADEFVRLELVHDPGRGVVEPGGLNHLVIQVEDLRATIDRLTAAGVQADAGKLPQRVRRLLDHLAHRSRRLSGRARPMA